jgi:hypothetical protein
MSSSWWATVLQYAELLALPSPSPFSNHNQELLGGQNVKNVGQIAKPLAKWSVN